MWSRHFDYLKFCWKSASSIYTQVENSNSSLYYPEWHKSRCLGLERGKRRSSLSLE